MRHKICILNGPNLNMLGAREPEIYGYETLADIEARCEEMASHLDVDVDFRQSNDEGQLVTWIQELRSGYAGVIINAAAYTHTSVAIRDALANLSIPIIEVHLSNIYKREEFRHHSYISSIAKGVICGLGATGYVVALQAMAEWVD